jgi:hypothetical protein
MEVSKPTIDDPQVGFVPLCLFIFIFLVVDVDASFLRLVVISNIGLSPIPTQRRSASTTARRSPITSAASSAVAGPSTGVNTEEGGPQATQARTEVSVSVILFMPSMGSKEKRGF